MGGKAYTRAASASKPVPTRVSQPKATTLRDKLASAPFGRGLTKK